MTLQLPWKYKEGQQYLLEMVPSYTEGIDVERLQAFFHEKGLRTSKVIFFPEKETRRVEQHIQRYLPYMNWEKDDMGMYSPALDLTFVQRRWSEERLNSPFFSEQLAAHELGHSTNHLYHEFVCKGTSLIKRFRLCSLLKRAGIFFEEGFAECMRAEYTERYQPLEIRDHIRSQLSQMAPNGINFLSPLDWTLALYKQDSCAISNYFHCGDHHLHLAPGAFPAMGLEILFTLRPNFREVFLSSRNTIEGFYRFMDEINNIQPGLYKKLSKLDCNFDDFRDGSKTLLHNIHSNNYGLSTNN